MTHATPADLILRALELEHEARWAGIDEENMRDEALNLRALASEALMYGEEMVRGANDNAPAMPASRGKEEAA